jgi:hypothetical protein
MELVREFLVGYRLHTAQMSGDIVMMRLSKLAVIKKIVSDEGLAEEVRKRALVQAYLTLAKGYFLVRDWRAAAKSVSASVAVSRGETATKFVRFFRRELEYWSLQLRQLLRSPATNQEPLRPFADFEPRERLDARTRHKLGYRSSLTRQTEARSNRQPQAVQGRTSQNPIN